MGQRLTLNVVGTEIFRKRAKCDSVVAVAGLWEASRTGENMIGIVIEVMGKTVIVAHYDKGIMLLSHFHERRQLGIIT